MRTKEVISILSIIALFLSCCSQKNSEADRHIPPKKCVQLNDSALWLVQEQYFTEADSAVLDLAENLLFEAIACDSDYYYPYLNLMDVLHRKKDYETVVSICDIMQRRFVDKAQAYAFKYDAYIQLNDTLVANKMRQEALSDYDKALKGSHNVVDILFDKIMFIMYVDGTPSAVETIDTISDKTLKETFSSLRSDLENLNDKD